MTARTARPSVCIALSLSLAGCGTLGAAKRAVIGGPDPNAPKILAGFIGGAVADEPRAALEAKRVLALGGNAADAAVTLGFMLSVTLPSRASLGGGGACIAYQPGENSPNHGVPEAITFEARAPAVRAGDRPAAIPMLARGLYLLSARYGTRDFASLMAPAQDAARTGFAVSRALADDLAPVAGPLMADPYARAVFAPNGTALTEGGRLVQPDLAATLLQIRAVGVGDFYQGLLAHRLAEATAAAGGPVTIQDLYQARPGLGLPVVQAAGRDQVASLPAPADAGAAVARPASTSFVVLDRKGGAVACALSMNNLFGTGRIAPGTGIVLAASPAAKPAALLAAEIAWDSSDRVFRAAVGGSGQNAALVAAASAMSAALSGGDAALADPGRANVIACPSGVPGGDASCKFTADPRGAGLAAVGG